MPRSYPSSQSEAIKSSTSQPVANFLIRSFCSLRNSARIRIAPRAGSQVTIERMLLVNTFKPRALNELLGIRRPPVREAQIGEVALAYARASDTQRQLKAS